jgi:Concanavalin A-like lectin/glucanases superfamily
VSRRASAGGNGSVQCEAPGTAPYLDGKWHHLAAVQSPAGMKLNLDGIERCTNTHGEDIRYDGGPTFFIGRHPDNATYDFEGNMDDVRIYGGALGPPEVLALAQGGG